MYNTQQLNLTQTHHFFLSWRSACSLLLAFLSITAQCTPHVRSCEMTIPSSLNSLARFTTVLPITMGLHTQLLYSRKSTAIVLHFLDLIIKITISSLVIGLKKSYFPLIHLPSCYRTVCYWIVCYWTVCYRTVQ